jgi:hypothetical protein
MQAISFSFSKKGGKGNKIYNKKKYLSMDKINQYVDEQLSTIFNKHSLNLRSKDELQRIIDERISEIESRQKKKSKKVKVD